MPTIIDGSTGVTFPAGGVGNPAGAVVGTTDTQTLTNKTISVSQLSGTTSEANGGTGTSTGYYGFKNRIINGAMVIDQRNAGASVTQNTSSQFVTDRFAIFGSVTSKFTAQRSTTAPAGFVNSLLITSSSAYTVGASERFQFRQAIEGVNVADLGWGAAGAQAVTLSFWVRSSLTGTFGGAFGNNAGDRSYPFSYTISAANTWEQKTINVAGDTSGTWLTDTNGGIWLYWGLGVGSTFSGTAGSWSGNFYIAPTGATSVVGTNGATFYITGVQLEKGSTATSFDYRPYGTELALCQRYYAKSYTTSTVPGTNTNNGSCRGVSTAGAGIVNFDYPVEMRAEPTVTPYSVAGTSGVFGSDVGNWTPTIYTSTRHLGAYGSVTSGSYTYGHYVASAEL